MSIPVGNILCVCCARIIKCTNLFECIVSKLNEWKRFTLFCVHTHYYYWCSFNVSTKMKWQCDKTVAKIKYENRKISWKKNRFSTPIDWLVGWWVCMCAIVLYGNICRKIETLLCQRTHIKNNWTFSQVNGNMSSI